MVLQVDLYLQGQREAERQLAGALITCPLILDDEASQVDPSVFVDELVRAFWVAVQAKQDEISRLEVEKQIEFINQIAVDIDGLIPDIYHWIPYLDSENGPITYQDAAAEAIEEIKRKIIAREESEALARSVAISHSQDAQGEAVIGPPSPPNFEKEDQPEQPKRTRWTLADLMEAVFPEPRWAVPDLIPVGLSILAGRPKLGKSWLALQLAHAKGTGGIFLGNQVDRGEVLYLALEDSPRRLKQRAEKQRIPINAGITFETEWRSFAGAGLNDLQIEIARDLYALITVDTISRAMERAGQLDLAEMTTIIGNLQSMAQNSDIAMLLIDHHRKNAGFTANVVDDILGSTGKSANPDCLLGLYREQGKHGATLDVVGREVEWQSLALEWDGLTCTWHNLGDAREVKHETLKDDIIQAISELDDLGEMVTTTNIANHLSENKGNVSRALADLVASGKVRRCEKVGRNIPYELVGEV